MSVQPNIDERGASLRLFGGVVLVAFASLPLVMGFVRHGGVSLPMIGGGAAMLALGSFMVYEGKKSWCGVKACALKLKPKKSA
jgi:hypothetical protein